MPTPRISALRPPLAAVLLALALPLHAANDPLKWDVSQPEALTRWHGVNVLDPAGGVPQKTWLWARANDLDKRSNNKDTPGYEVPAQSLRAYDLCVPMFKLTETGRENRRFTIKTTDPQDKNKTIESEADGVVVNFKAELSPNHRLCVKYDGYLDVRRVGSDFAISAQIDPPSQNGGTLIQHLNMNLTAAQRTAREKITPVDARGGMASAWLDGKPHRAIVQPPGGAATPTTPQQPPARATLPELTPDEIKWLLDYEKKMYGELLDKAKTTPSGLSAIPSVEGDLNSPKLTNEQLYRKQYEIFKRKSDARRQDPTLFLSEADRALLGDKLKDYLAEYEAALLATKSDAELRAITKKYYDMLYPADRLADHELAGLTPGEKAEFEKEKAAAAKDQPSTVQKVVSMWRGFARRKAAGKATYWDLFVPSDAALAPYGDQAAKDAIRAKLRNEADLSKTPEQNFESRVNLGQRYYCTGQTIRSTIKPNDKSSKTIDLLRELAANPQADRVKVDGQADRAVAPNPDPLCQGSLWNRERQDELTRGDQRPTNTASFKAGDIPSPATPAPAKPGQYNDIINAGKFGMYTAILGFFLGGPIGALLLGVIGVGFAYFMGKVK